MSDKPKANTAGADRQLAQITAGRLRAVFFRADDRVRHEVQRADADVASGLEPHWKVVARSVEGDESQDWPASPPLRDVHIETHGAQVVALAVGMAGKSHWSASIVADPAQETITFDFACRVKESPVWLGSRYTAMDPSVTLTVTAGQLLPATAFADACQIVPLAPAPNSQWPITLRWGYRFLWKNFVTSSG